ncbi:MAG: hypothetical protein KF774_19965, partial [Planctomyces sp.]|nr:hypothetical protein [Planctomyces sp.]
MAVTGIGIVSPLGATAEEHWRRVVAGERAGRWLPELSDGLPATPAASWMHWCGAPPRGWPPCPEPGVLNRLARVATADCLAGAGSEAIDSVPPERRGCIIGVSKPALTAPPGEPRNLSADALDAGGAAALEIAAAYGCEGAVSTPAAACATGLVSLIQGAEWIRRGDGDVALAGSADWSLAPAYLAAYRRLGVLARAGDDPATACRPFDRDRSGFLVGAGAAILLLEDWDHAERRGASILAEWLGSALVSDAASLVDFDPSGETPARAVRDALHRSGLARPRIDVASLHGTGTLANDRCETRGLTAALGEAARSVSCFSLKGSIGHLMGAAGSVETATL